MKILYCSPVPWGWIKQRPHFISFYLSLLGSDVEFLSIDNIINVNLLYQLLYRQKLLVRNKLNKISTSFRIRKVWRLPLESKISVLKYINQWHMKRALKIAVKNKDVVIFTHPRFLESIESHLQSSPVIVYEAMDNYIGFVDDPATREVLRKQEKELCHLSKLVIVSSSSLRKRLVQEYSLNPEKVKVINNACDSDTILNFVRLECPVEDNCIKGTENLSKNILVTYVGTVGRWIDFDSLHSLSNVPQAKIVMIGPVDKHALSEVRKLEHKVSFLGPLEHQEAIRYMAKSNVLLIPFKDNEVVRFVDPVKIYEYIPFNKIIISSYWEEIARFRDFVYFYTHPSELPEVFREAIKKGPRRFVDPAEFCAENNWERRAIEYKDLLENIYHKEKLHST